MRFAWLVCVGWMLWSCQPGGEVTEPDLGYSFFPLQVGRYQVYAIDSSYYKQNVLIPVTYSLKVTMVDSTVNAEGGFTYKLLLQKRKSAAEQWNTFAVNTVRISNNKVIVNEGNVPFIRLMFPVQNGLTWNGNAFNTLGGEQACGSDKNIPCDEYVIEKWNEPFAVSSQQNFDKTLTVVQNNRIDAIVGDDVRKDVYADGVGLIYREANVVEYCTNANACTIGSKFILSGVNYKQMITAYGKE